MLDCQFPNCRRDHSAFDILKACDCCKFNLFQRQGSTKSACFHGERCRRTHLKNCLCIQTVNEVLSKVCEPNEIIYHFNFPAYNTGSVPSGSIKPVPPGMAESINSKPLVQREERY